MSIKDFSEIQYVTVMQDNITAIELATLLPTESFQLDKIMVKVFLMGDYSTESLKLKIYSGGSSGVLFAESNSVVLNNVGNNFIGWLTFNFNKQEILSGFSYQITATSSGYSRNANLKYISFIHDWPIRKYSSTNIYYTVLPSKYPKAVQIFGRQ